MLSGFVLVVTLAACGGDDLGKSNFQRDTVEPQPGQAGGSGAGDEPVPSGPIDDPAVSTEALRKIDPCQLMNKDTLSGLGQPDNPEEQEFGECVADIKDPGGKEIKARLKVSESIAGGADKAEHGLEGLPLVEEQQDGGSCFVTAVTSKDPDMGIQAQIDYQGGDPCKSGRTLLQKALQQLHSNPPVRQESPGTISTIDPCQYVDEATVKEVAGDDAAMKATRAHSCGLGGMNPSLDITFGTGTTPTPDYDTTEVDLGNGVKGFKKGDTVGSSTCKITWQHKPTADNQGELVIVDYSNYSPDVDPKADDACGKVTKVATNVAGKLPKP